MKNFSLLLFFILLVNISLGQTNAWWEHANLPDDENPYISYNLYNTAFVAATDTVNDITYVAQIRSSDFGGQEMFWRYDGESWELLGVYDGEINVMCEYHGYLYAGLSPLAMIYQYLDDSLTTFSSGYLSRFDGETWESIQVDGPVTSLEVIDDTLYVGGEFETVGFEALSSPRAAKFDGENWHALPDNPFVDMPNFISINAFEKYQGELYVGGVSPDVNDEDLLVYHNGFWEAVGVGVPGLHTKIDFLETFDGNLYAAGIIMAEEGNPGNGIQKWDGESWSQLGGGLNGVRMIAMQKYDDGLFVGGLFSHAGDVETSGIARWDGSKWCGLHTSTENQIVPGMFVNSDQLYMPLFQNPTDPFFDDYTEIYKWIGGDDFGPCTTPVSVENPREEMRISVFPNPVEGESIRVQSDRTIINIRLYDLAGKIVYSSQVNTKAASFELSTIQSGIYFLQIKTTNGTLTKKLIRN